MKQLIVTLLLLVATEYSLALIQNNYGNGILYVMNATDDVFVEDVRNQDRYDFLIVGNHPHYPLKRTLVKFEDIPNTCKSIQWAKMYLYFWYSHKASGMSNQEVPYILRPLQVNQIRKYWNENTATRYYSQSGIKWSIPYLGLDGSDAVAEVLDVVTVYTGRPHGHMEFDITQAARNWLSGEPNYGVVISATNEQIQGREARFYSREHGNDWRFYPRMSVLCSYGHDSTSSTSETALIQTSSVALESSSSETPIIWTLVRLPSAHEATSSGQIIAVSSFQVLMILLCVWLVVKTNDTI